MGILILFFKMRLMNYKCVFSINNFIILIKFLCDLITIKPPWLASYRYKPLGRFLNAPLFEFIQQFLLLSRLKKYIFIKVFLSTFFAINQR